MLMYLWASWHFTRAFPQRIAGTLVGQEHAPTETSRPLSTGPDLALHTCVSPTHRRNPCGPGTCAHWDFQTPVHWPRPLWSFAKFRGRPSLATPLIGFGADGDRPHVHPAGTVRGPYWHSVCGGLHVFLVLGQYFRIVVIMRLRI